MFILEIAACIAAVMLVLAAVLVLYIDEATDYCIKKGWL